MTSRLVLAVALILSAACAEEVHYHYHMDQSADGQGRSMESCWWKKQACKFKVKYTSLKCKNYKFWDKSEEKKAHNNQCDADKQKALDACENVCNPPTVQVTTTTTGARRLDSKHLSWCTFRAETAFKWCKLPLTFKEKAIKEQKLKECQNILDIALAKCHAAANPK